ncbi:variant erythrocyte surface antigen-1 family protein [Babesia caballi]|uniref:Variant erythrocyte surface antigen-1 family protein n=1 Tax=Babesia caballi TaxID=5871 RepID=A0AAV4LX09_BABCB|nr:variant erythrocyte surface antigen-1 family protein [Babesia caballi]
MKESGPKSLTAPPRDLKEAIDWVTKINELSAIHELAQQLDALLKHDGSEVAMIVLDKYRLVSESVIEGLKSHTTEKNRLISTTSQWGFSVPQAILHNLSKGLDPFPSGSAAISREKAERWVETVQEKSLETLIESLANGLEAFVKPTSGILTSPSIASAYSQADAKWESLQASEHKDCAAILIGIMPVVYFGLTYLYWRCEGTGGWATKRLDQEQDFKQFWVAFGYTEKDLVTSETGKIIATQLQSASFSEMKNAYDTAKPNHPQNESPSYPTFLKALQDEALGSTPPNSSSPLTSLYLLGYYYITYPLYKVQSTSPAPPSFTGYSGLTALAGGAYGFNLGGLGTFMSALLEAIDWILRVTGKDGGSSNQGNEAKLAKAITELPGFNEAVEVAAKKLKESRGDDANVSQALERLKESNTLGPIVKKLAEGLAGFIGYGGGQGIADLVDPLQQLRKGVLMFLMELIRKFKGSYSNKGFKDNDAVNELSKAMRKGKQEFESALDKVGKLEGGNSPVTNVVSALKKVTELKNKQTNASELAGGVKTFLTQVLTAVNSQAPNQVDSLKTSLPALIDAYGKRKDIRSQIQSVETHYKRLHANRSSNVAEVLTSAVHYGTESLLKQLKTGGYQSSYPFTHNWNGDTSTDKMAKTFLGCLPLYYYWLTYLYWKCKQTRDKGGWETQWFSGAGGTNLMTFMVGQGYVREHLTRKSGKNIAPLLEKFYKLKDSMQTASGTPATTQTSHPDLLNELNKSLQRVIGASGSSGFTALNGHSLSALFYLCRCYFTGKQIINPVTEQRLPTSIREMLYWISGLQFSPHYSDIEKQIDNVIPSGGLPVADSSVTVTSSTGDTLTQNHMKGFLLSSCLSAPGVLGAIQGNTADTENEPWLYSLFCNSMNFTYPSGRALFNTLANYSYALQFQLLFLYAQCRSSMCHVPMGFTSALTTGANATGWYIYYLLEHFCGGSKTPLRQLSEKFGCLTKRTPRSLGDLFGFLWNLNGQLFGDKKPIMADMAKKLVDAIGQNKISSKIPSFIVDLLEKIGGTASPPLATPASSSPTALSRSLESMAPTIPFLYQLFMAKDSESLPVVLFDLNQQCHKVEVQNGGRPGSSTTIVTHNQSTGHACSTSPADLYSLQTSQCTRGPNCGPYLSPLTHTTGSAFAPIHASSYLSWVLYLADDLQAGLQRMLDVFGNVECSSHSLSSHDSSGNCSCQSVVHCGGVLPLLYSNGFTFANAYSLKNPQTKRTCQQFHKQLTAVLAPNESTPLFKLLTTIDDFLYLFRIYFFYNLSTFWIMYVCIVLYIYFLLADLLHLKSHVRLPSSHGVPPLALLTSGKPLPITKLTYITQ